LWIHWQRDCKTKIGMTSLYNRKFIRCHCLSVHWNLLKWTCWDSLLMMKMWEECWAAKFVRLIGYCMT
jgi:hypothetical protein